MSKNKITVQRAIQVMKKFTGSDVNELVDRAHKKAIEELEKRVPKKPTLEGDGYAPDGSLVLDEWICPRCNFRYEIDYEEHNYCPNCGQAIDWSDEE